MGVRDYNFIVGPQTATLPTPTTPSASADFVSKGYADTNYGPPAMNVTGTRASPTLITAGSGITPGSGNFQLMFIAGNGSAVDVSANPQISGASTVGRVLKLIARHATNTVKLEDGNGLLMNGSWTGGEDDCIEFIADGTNWVETSRR